MKTNQKSLGVNAFLSVLKVMLSIVTPLITFPYASRVLGVNNIGKVNFGSSIVVYISLIAALGISTYAVREGARRRESKKEFEIFAREIFTTNLLTTIFSYVILAFCLFAFSNLHDYRLLIAIQSLSVFFTTIGVEWINTIYEDYFYILIRSFAIQLLNILCLFIFVRSPEDYYIYASITVITTATISIINLFHVRKYCHLKLIFPCGFIKHLKPALVFFSSSLAVNIYMSADATMLGLLAGDFYSGIYAVSVKMYTIAKTVLNCIYTVTIPRLSIYAEKRDFENYRITLTRVTASLMLILFPIVTFFILLSDSIILVIAGKEYLAGTTALRILAAAIVFSLVNGILVNCINVTLNREKINSVGTALAAIVNIGLNFIFIPLFQHNGAAFTTLIAEATVSIFCISKLKDFKKIIDVKEVVLQILCALIGCGVISVVCIVTKLMIRNTAIGGIVGGVLGCIVYCSYLYLVKNKYFISIFNVIIKRIKR